MLNATIMKLGIEDLEKKVENKDLEIYTPISKALQRDHLPRPNQFQEVYGEHLEHLGWLMIGAFQGGYQKNGLGLTRHSFDAAFKFLARDVCDLSGYDVAVTTLHDIPEDVLIPRGKNGIRPLVAAHATLDFLADIAGCDIAYGLPVKNDQERVGGVKSSTNFDGLLVGPVLDSIDESDSFVEERMVPDRTRFTLIPGSFFYLTDNGRQHFLDSLAKYKDGFRVESDEIVTVLRFLQQRYRDLDTRISKEHWDHLSKLRVRSYSESFVSALEDRIRNNVDPAMIMERIDNNYLNVVSILSDPDKEMPVDAELILVKSPYRSTISKTLYGSGHIESIGEAVKALFHTEYSRKNGLYLSPIKEKNSDASETISSITPGISPALPTVTSINRKAKLLAIKDIEILNYLKQNGADPDEIQTMYKMPEFLLDVLDERLEKMRDASRESSESSSEIATETYGNMHGKIMAYQRELQKYSRSWLSGLRLTNLTNFSW